MALAHNELLTKAKVILQTEHPFFSYILFYCKFRPIEQGEDNKKGRFQLPVETMGIDKNLNVYYNPKFVEDNAQYIKGILVHEIMHVVLKHHDRFDDMIDTQHQKNRMLANIAMDAVINLSLNKMGIKLMDMTIQPNKDGILYDISGQRLEKPIKVEGRSWEEVYQDLKKLAKEEPQNYSGDIISNEKSDGQGNKDNNPQDGTAPQLTQEEIDNIIQDATNYAKLQGKLGAEMERLIDAVYNTTTPWQKILRQNFQSFIPFDYNYKKPNRRSYSINTFIPHANKKPSVKIYVAIDTSGSIGQEDMTYFVSELFAICKQFSLSEMTVMFCDSKIANTQVLKSEHELKSLKPKGGGGTSFIPIFDEMEKKYKATSRDMLIYFTDLAGDFPTNKKYPFQTIWMSTSNIETVPFGKIIRCNIPTRKD